MNPSAFATFTVAAKVGVPSPDKALYTPARIRGQKAAIVRTGYDTQRVHDKRRVIPSLFKTGFQVKLNIFFGFEVFR